jgi:hypothetical protein
MLIKEDFPTLLLPINAYSLLSGTGHFSKSGLLIIYLADLISMRKDKEKAIGPWLEVDNG